MGTETNQFFKEFGEPISIGTTAVGGILGAIGNVREGKPNPHLFHLLLSQE